jgi:hypothetical protein
VSPKIRRILCLASVWIPSLAWTDVITTDRPSFSNSTYTVPRGSLQLETGVSRQKSQDSDGTQTWLTQTPVLLRGGITSAFEARLGWDGYEWRRVDHDASEGAGDMGGGFKWRQLDQAGWKPAIASIVSVAFPSGAPAIRRLGIRPGLQVPLDWQLPAACSLTAMPGISYDTTEDNKRFWDPVFGIVAGQSWTGNFQTFIEWAGQQFAPVEDGGVVQTLNAGATWQVLPNWQLDGAVWYGLNRNSPIEFFTLGLSTRFLNVCK